LLALACSAVVVAACAPMIVTQPVRLEAAPAAAPPSIVIRDLVAFKLPTGYNRTLAAGSRWLTPVRPRSSLVG
jgi:hypothetical protein